MDTNDFDKTVQQFKDDFELQLGSSELVFETKELVDRLIIQLLNTTQKFVSENNLTNESHYIGAMVTHRAFFYMSTSVTNNWCMDVALRKFIQINESTFKKEFHQ